MRKVAVLCAAATSEYKRLEGVEVYDKRRDARTFPGGMPVVAHPPCRGWSRWLWRQAKPEKGERELALFCVEQVRRWGGVLEHPRLSWLWPAARLPLPGRKDRWGFCIEVWQVWWGFPCRKATWLYIVGVDEEDLPPIPFRLHPGGDHTGYKRLSRHQRMEFARWLVEVARKCKACKG